MQRDEVIKRLASNLNELRNQYHVTDLSIFGSVARKALKRQLRETILSEAVRVC